MDKQKQIEDLTALIDSFNIRTIKQAKYVAEYIVDKLNYRKIPEGAVVLTKEEYEKHKGFSREEVDEISETAIKNSRKETAEKFAEMLKDEHSGIEQDKDGEHLVIVLDEEELDEICKEITEGK